MSQLSNNSNNLTHPPLILIADDDSTTRFLQRIVLEKNGYAVTEAEDGVQALSIYERLKPDLVLLDAMMPLLDGFSACARLRALPGGDNTPILMVTALQDDEAVARAFDVGATDYIIKPVNTTVLYHRVRRLLRAQQVETAVRQRERFFRAIIEEQTEPVCRFLPDGTLTFVNEAYCRYYGKSSKELIGYNFLLLIPPEDREVVKKQLSSLSLENRVEIIECKVMASNGAVQWQQWTYRVSLDEDGQLAAVQAVGQDITELRQVSAELHQKTAELQVVIETIPDMFFRLNSEGLILEHYAGSTSDWYLPLEAINGKYLQDILPPEIASPMYETVVNVHQKKESCTLEYSFPLEAYERTFEARFRPFLDSQVIMLIRNTTQCKYIEG